MDEKTRNTWKLCYNNASKEGYNNAIKELIDYFSEFEGSEEFYVVDIKKILEGKRK